MSEFIMIIFWISGVIIMIFLLTVCFGAPFVPTHTSSLRKLFCHLKLNKQHDVLVDLGSGNGKVLRLAAPFVKQAIGYEINPMLLCWSKWLLSCHQNIQVRLADFRWIKLPPETTVLYVFCVRSSKPAIIKLIQHHLKRTKRTLILISYGFEFEVFGQPEAYCGFCIYKIRPKSTSKKL